MEADVAQAEADMQTPAPSPPVTLADQPPPPNWTPDIMVEKFLALRAKTAELRKRQAAEMAPYNLIMGKIEGWLLNELHTNRVNSMRANAGTFFTSKRTSATVVSWAQALDFVRDNEAWELLEARVSSTAAQAIMQERGEAIPGVKISTEETLSVRAAR
jgi:hypothetical protein